MKLFVSLATACLCLYSSPALALQQSSFEAAVELCQKPEIRGNMSFGECLVVIAEQLEELANSGNPSVCRDPSPIKTKDQDGFPQTLSRCRPF